MSKLPRVGKNLPPHQMKKGPTLLTHCGQVKLKKYHFIVYWVLKSKTAMNSCFLRILQMITEWTMNGFSIPLLECCWKTTKIIYFFKIFVQKLHVILSFHSYHTYCMFGEVSYPKLANVQNKNSFYIKKKKEWRREKYIYKYIYIYLSILYFTWSRVIFCRFLCIHKVIFVL